jgi:predicted transcriptional regulator
MKPFCEIVVSDVLPALRAIVAREMMQLGLNQVQVSKKMGITQPAVSQYMRELRGYRVKLLTSNAKVSESVKELAHDMVTKEMKSDELHVRFCEICKTIRAEHLLCKLHKDSYPAMDACDVCFR